MRIVSLLPSAREILIAIGAAEDADVVVTQDLCAVCAVDVTNVDDALAHIGCRANPAARVDVEETIAAGDRVVQRCRYS
jgi:hypothetical protein